MSAPHAAIEAREFQSLEEEQRFRTLAEEIRCLVCQNQSLADSGAGLATDLRDEILRLMREGKSNAEIKAFLTTRYGDFVLYRPPVKPGTWALWFGPVAMVLVGGAIVAATIRRRSRGDALVPDPEQQELDRRLAELDPDALPADELHPPARSTPASAPSERFAAGEEPPPRPSDDGPPGDDPAAAHDDVAPSGNDRLERDDPIGPRDEETPR